MKRIGNIYQSIVSLENLRKADEKARRGKAKQYGVLVHDRNKEDNIRSLHQQLISKTYRTSTYKTFTIVDPKEREIWSLPYFPDRITHHAIMHVLEPIFVSTFTADTYSCIKDRGIHLAATKLKQVLKSDNTGTRYCLKIDVRKFYPSIDHSILKNLLQRKFKDQDLLWLLFEIIDSAPGVPIGNYLSQFFANFYLSYMDHWIKEELRVKYYFRYLDDMIFLADSKSELHGLLAAVRNYLREKLNLEVKQNYQVFDTDIRGIDILGYRFFHTHTLLRKRIKKNYARAMSKGKINSIPSFKGWAKHANCKHLTKKLNEQFQIIQHKEQQHINVRREQNQNAESIGKGNHSA